MNSTKRKFNALLNGIGNKSSTSLSSREVNNGSHVDLTSTGDGDSQAKKRCMADSISSLSHSTSLSKSTIKTSSPPTAMQKKSTSHVSETVAAETPKYTPWDRADFLKRLKSFSNLTDWTPKPARVNEVEWAKRGWVCQKFERVRCCLCNVEILVKLNRKEVDGKEEPVYIAQNIEDALVDRYAELIVTSHDENCLWRERGCDDSIFKLPLSRTQAALPALRERYDELCTRRETLPYKFNMQTPEELDLELVLSYLPPGFFTSPTPETATEIGPTAKVNEVAFMMALFGWQGHTHERLGVQLGSVSCQACFRVLGLWLFKSKDVNEAGDEVAGPVVNCLNVVEEHRDYCPWRNAASQNGQKTANALPGWQIILRLLRNDFHLRHGGERQTEKTTTRPGTVDSRSDVVSVIGTDADDDAKSTRDVKDKERWARLRRVKSLFDTKAAKRLHRLTGSHEAKSQPRS